MALQAIQTEESNRKQNIFELGADLDTIASAFDRLEENGEDPETLAQIEEFFGNLLDKRDEKLDAYARLIRAKRFYANARKEEGKRLAAMAKADDNAADRMEQRLEAFLKLSNITKIETAQHKFSIEGKGGLKPLEIVQGLDPQEVATNTEYAHLVKTTYAFDNTAIRAALDAGEEVPFAKYGERGTGLRIR